MQIATHNREGMSVCRVSFDSHLDLSQSLDCLRQLRSMDLNQLHSLEFDLVRAPSIESAGLGLLMSVRDRWGSRVNTPVIRCVRGPVHEILNICRMQRYFEIELLY